MRLQFLGFRYHGWQKQPGVKTIQQMMEKTIRFVLGEEEKFKILSAGRTDAMVSAQDFPCELFVYKSLDEDFVERMNYNLPQDIKLLSIEPVPPLFNVIKDVKEKTYRYYFQYEGDKNPMTASQITFIPNGLDIDLMQAAAIVLEGTHDFGAFTVAPPPPTKVRTITSSKIVKEEGHYYFEVKGKGFMRYQVRLMMGALLEVGKGNMTLDSLKKYLQDDYPDALTCKASASGLTLYKVAY